MPGVRVEVVQVLELSKGAGVDTDLSLISKLLSLKVSSQTTQIRACLPSPKKLGD